MIPASCPDARTWQAILDDDGDAAEWLPHLESCADCQNRLQALAADEASWADAAHRLKQVGAAVGDPALRCVMERAKREEAPGATEAERPSDEDLPPTFFRPADKPGLLGYLGHYEVLEAIGRGGMGVVFKAFDPALHRMAAVKVLAPQLAGSAAARRRFLREGRNAAAVTHDHIVTIYDVDEYEGFPYLVMQYVAGMSLQEKLDHEGPPPLADILRIGMQTASGLAAAHAQGLIHRDIKPANILLENGVQRVKITDFGLARGVDDASCTHSGVVAGTPAYMAPEQARGEPPDPRADLFSLGSVLYALCTGRPPYRDGSSLAVVRRVADEAPPRVRNINPAIPEWLDEIVSRLHAMDPARRLGSAAAVADLLERHLAHLQQPASNPMPARLTDRPPASRRPRLRRWLCAAAILLAIGVAFGVSEASGVTQVVQAVATALRITTPYGTLVVETDDPDVKVKVDGEDVVITGAGVQEVRVKAGQHHFQAVKGGVPVRDELVSISRGGKEVVKVSLEGSPSATAATPTAAPGEPPTSAPGGVVRSSRTVWTWPGDPAKGAGVSCGAISADGKTVVSGSWDGTVRIFDVEAGKERKTIPGLATGLRGLAISPDSQTLATGGSDLMVHLWDLDSGKPRQALGGYSGRIMALAFSPDGKTLASAGGNFGRGGELKLWDLASGKERVLVEPFARELWGVAFSPDGKSVAVAVGDGTVQIVDLSTGKTTATFTHPSYARRVAFSPDGKTLAVGLGEEGFVALWDLDTNKQRVAFQPHKAPLHGLSFGPGGKLLTCSPDGTAVVWNVGKTQVEQAVTLAGHQGTVCFAAFAPDGKTVVTGGGNDKTVRVWNVGPGDPGSKPAPGVVPETSLTFPTGAAEGLSCGALSPDGKTLVTCCWDGSATIWDAASGKERKTIRGLSRTPRTVAVSPDNRMFAVAADDKVIRVYDLDSGEPRATLAGHVAVIHALAFSPDGKTLASAGGDEHLHLAGELKLWDLSTGKERMLIAPFDRPVWSLAYAPDGKSVAVALGYGTVMVVDATTGKAETVFPHPQYARRIAYSADGKTLAVAYGDDGFVALWDLETRKERYAFQAHAEGRRGPLLDMAFRPDGKQFVTCGTDGPAMVWNVGKTQVQEAFTLTGYEGKSWFAGFSPDGRMVVTGGDDRTVRFWKLNAKD